MGTLLDARDREAIDRRIAALTAESRGGWGRLTLTGMLGHLCESARMALGELPVRPKKRRLFQVFPVKHLVLYVLPFPRSVPTAPELLAIPADELEGGRERLRALFTRVGQLEPRALGPAHPLLGTLSGKEWAVLTYKHADHHLRQFGV